MVARDAEGGPASTIAIASRSTPGTSGPRSTRSPRKTASRPSGWLGDTGALRSGPLRRFSRAARAALELRAAAVHVADDVERPVLVAPVVPQLLSLDGAASTSSGSRARTTCGSPPASARGALGAAGALLRDDVRPKSRSARSRLRSPADSGGTGRGRSPPPGSGAGGPAHEALARLRLHVGGVHHREPPAASRFPAM